MGKNFAVAIAMVFVAIASDISTCFFGFRIVVLRWLLVVVIFPFDGMYMLD